MTRTFTTKIPGFVTITLQGKLLSRVTPHSIWTRRYATEDEAQEEYLYYVWSESFTRTEYSDGTS